MQMSKYFTVLSVTALLAGAADLHAETEAQARAREALRQKMLELDAQQQPAPRRAAPAKPVTPAPAMPPAEAAPRPPVAPVAAPAAGPARAVSTSAPPVRQDDEAVARARAAMRQEIENSNVQQQPAPRRAAPAKPVTPAPAPPLAETAPRSPVAPVITPAPAPAPAVTTSVPPVRQDDEAIARARAAMRQEIQDLKVQQQPAPRRAAPAKSVARTPAPPVTQPTPLPPVAPVAAPTPAAPVIISPVTQDDEAVVRARAAMRQETHQSAAPAPAPAVHGRVKAPRGGATVVFPEAPAPSVAPSIRSPEAPPSPIPATKELELAELLRKYRADEISPEDYHKQRAAILARP